MNVRSEPSTRNLLPADARVRVAINAHRFHNATEVLTACESVALAEARLIAARPAMRVETILYLDDPAHFGTDQADRIRALGFDLAPCPGASNGARLNRQIEAAIASDCDLYLRVDADDTVTPDRFLRQIALFETLDSDIIGGGLIYQQGDARGFPVLPSPVPRPLDYVLNRYMLHQTLGFRVASLRRTGLRYWDGRLEDKELLLRAVGAGLRLSNDPTVWGTYHVSPQARSTPELADLAHQLDLRFLQVQGGPLLVPLAHAVHLARRVLPVSWLRRLRSRLTRDRSGLVAAE